METPEIREKLHQYIDIADESKIEAMYKCWKMTLLLSVIAMKK